MHGPQGKLAVKCSLTNAISIVKKIDHLHMFLVSHKSDLSPLLSFG